MPQPAKARQFLNAGPWLELFVNGRWKSLILPAIILCVLVLALLSAAAWVGTYFFDLEVNWNGVHIGRRHQPQTIDYIAVAAASGFQASRVYLRNGDKVRLEPTGRVHVAVGQLYNLSVAIKPLISRHAKDRTLRSQYGAPPDLKPDNYKTEFYRDWAGPGGEGYDSEMLGACKLVQSRPFGALLAITMKDPVRLESWMTII